MQLVCNQQCDGLSQRPAQSLITFEHNSCHEDAGFEFNSGHFLKTTYEGIARFPLLTKDLRAQSHGRTISGLWLPTLCIRNTTSPLPDLSPINSARASSPANLHCAQPVPKHGKTRSKMHRRPTTRQCASCIVSTFPAMKPTVSISELPT